MKELSYGAYIKVGDCVKVGNGFHKVRMVDANSCCVKLNKFSSLKFPITYTENFRSLDSSDTTFYRVYTCDLDRK